MKFLKVERSSELVVVEDGVRVVHRDELRGDRASELVEADVDQVSSGRLEVEEREIASEGVDRDVEGRELILRDEGEISRDQVVCEVERGERGVLEIFGLGWSSEKVAREIESCEFLLVDGRDGVSEELVCQRDLGNVGGGEGGRDRPIKSVA